MDWIEVEPGVWRSGEYEIRHVWFSVRDSYDLYFKGQPIGGYDTFELAKEAASRTA
jgi:hypothetical protein